MSNKNNLVPKRRFPEFRDAGAWEEKRLGDVLDYVQPTNFLVKNTAYNDSYKTPVLTAGKTFVLGYTNETFGLFTDGLPVIIFDDFTTATKYVDFPFKAKSSAMKILTPKKSENIKYIYETMQRINLKVGVHARHWISKFSKLSIPYPNLAEQQKIAYCLSSLDGLITAEAQKLDSLKTHKKGLMQQLFPAEGKTQPKRRFSEFRDAGAWNVETLEQLTMRIGDGIHSTPKYNNDGNYYFINGNNLVDGKISISKSTKKVDENEAKEHSRYLSSRTILLSINGTIGNLAIYGNEKVVLGKSSAYINVKDAVDIKFIYNILKTPKIKRFLFSELTGSTIKNLSLKTIRKTKIPIPILPEQQKIADCLSSIDDLITAETQKLDSIKTHKKGLMQQLFPAVDEVNR